MSFAVDLWVCVDVDRSPLCGGAMQASSGYTHLPSIVEPRVGVFEEIAC
jgi:hypothetical protein